MLIKTSKKFISLFLSVVMIFSCAIPAFAAGPEFVHNNRVNVPTVYVHGYGNYIYKDKNDSHSEAIYSGDGDLIPQSSIDAAIAGIKEPLLYGIKTDDWDPYSDFLINAFKKDLSKFVLDDNGEASDGSGNDFNHDMNAGNRIGRDGKYDLFSYEMNYDWRLDPVVLAEQLNTYIKRVKQVTGYDKVNLVGRCLGGNIVMAYLYKYGFDDINALEFYIGLFNGIDLAGALFSGRVNIDPNALNRFVEKYIPEDGEDMSIIKAIVAVLNVVQGLNLPIDLVYKVYEEVYERVIPEMLAYSYGTMPSYWSFVGPKYYEDAKKLFFAGQEERYAELIKKIDHYHYDIVPEFNNIINNALEAGVEVYNFAKYGGTMVPACDESMYQNDNVTTIVSQTFGSVGSKINWPFGIAHMNKARKNGTLKYISADNNVDASQDILRDHTWFIRGSGHANMPYEVNYLMANVFNASGYGDSANYITTDYFEDYPQFLIADKDAYDIVLSPLTKENLDMVDPWHQSVFDRFLFLLQNLFDFVTDLVRTITQTVENEKEKDRNKIII